MVELCFYTAVTAVRFCHEVPHIRSVAQSGSAPGLGPGGPKFESLYSDQVLPLKPLMDEVLFCKQEKSVRFRTGAPITEGYQDWVLHCLESRWTAKAVRVRFYYPSSKQCVWFVEYVWPSKPKDAGSNPVTRSKFCKCRC